MCSGSTPALCKEDVDALDFLAERGRVQGMPLSLCERRVIAEAASASGSRYMTASDWQRLISTRYMADQERLTISEYLVKSHDLHLGQRVLQWIARLGISFFSLAGAYSAGEAGMHVVGATFVGVVTGLGGGTLNNIMVGATPVGWMRDTTLLAAAVAASVMGFYVWPLAERVLADGKRYDVASTSSAIATEQSLSDDRATAAVDGTEVPSLVHYALESIALGALAVIGAQQGIVRGLHPVVSSCLGVTTAFGGVLRDLMCHRELKLGAASGCQSYAVASLSGASVYVLLRELHVYNCAGSTSRLVHGGIPIGVRIVLGAGTAVIVRMVAWWRKAEGDLFMTMDECAIENSKWVSLLFKSGR